MLREHFGFALYNSAFIFVFGQDLDDQVSYVSFLCFLTVSSSSMVSLYLWGFEDDWDAVLLFCHCRYSIFVFVFGQDWDYKVSYVYFLCFLTVFFFFYDFPVIVFGDERDAVLLFCHNCRYDISCHP